VTVEAALLERGADVNAKDNVRRATCRRPAPRALCTQLYSCTRS
jgi:hypothetical protein